MNICLEGHNGEWDWFEADLREPDLGINREQVKSICGTTNPQVIDIEYDDDEPYKELLQYNGMGWTSLNSLVDQAEQLAQFEDYELEQIAAYMNTKSGNLSYAMDHFDNHQYWKTDNSNIEDFAREYLEETGYDADFLAQYFDYAALGEELLADPDYEPLSDNGNAWDEGELYIDNIYGSVEDFIANHDLDTVFDYYFDLDGFANGDLRYSFDYDDQTGIWVSESVNKKSGRSKLRESVDLTQVFKDPQGMFGEPGAIVTAQELKDYWDEEYEWDPSLQDFNSFEDWYEDTIEWFEPINESNRFKQCNKKHIKESHSEQTYTGKTWKDFINNLESNSNYKVDSAYRCKYDNWIELIDNNGNIYDAEVTMYRDRLGNTTYELVDYNIAPSHQYESVRKHNNRSIKESVSKRQYDSLQNACMDCNSYDELRSILSSLKFVNSELYNKYSQIFFSDKYSAAALAKDISDDLYYAFPEYND